MPPLLVVAEVRRTHGLAGEVLADVLTDFPERLHEGVSVVWRSGGSERTLTVRRARPHGRRLRLAFDGVETVDAARALQGGDLCVAIEDAHPAPEGFYYSHEVEGFPCEDPAGRSLGTATGLAQDRGRSAADRRAGRPRGARSVRPGRSSSKWTGTRGGSCSTRRKGSSICDP